MAIPKEQILQELVSRHHSEVDFAFMDGPLPGQLPPGITVVPLATGCLPPFWPFLTLVQEQWQRLGEDRREEILEDSELYYFHRDLWRQILSGENPVRKEEILPGEMDYEYRRFRGDLRLICSSVLFPVEQVFLAPGECSLPESTLDFLEDLAADPPSGKAFFLFSSPACPQNQSRFVWDSGRYLGLPEDPVWVPDTGRSAPKPLGSLEQGLLAYHLCALKDAVQLLEPLLEGAGEESLRAAAALGRTEFFLRDMDKAMTYFQTSMAEAQKTGNFRLLAWSYRWMARIYLKEDQLPLALATLEKAVVLASHLSDPWEELHNALVRFMLEDRRRFQGLPEFKSFYKGTVEVCRALGAWNYFSYIATNPFGLFSCYDDEVGRIHKTGLKVAGTKGNLHRLAVAYQTTGLAAAVQGRTDETLVYYRKSYRLKKRLGNPLELAYSLNGLGFHSLMTGRYPQALRYFRKSLGKLSQIYDFHEVSMTYFNLAMTALMAGDPNRAMAFMDVVKEVMGKLGLRNLKYHSRAGILALTGVAAYLSGRKERGMQAARMLSLEELEPYPLKNEEYFFLNILRFFQKRDVQDVMAGECLKIAEEYLLRTNDDITYMGPFFYLLAAREGGEEYRSRYMARGWDMAREKKFPDYMKWYENWSASGDFPPPVEVSWPRQEDLSWMIQAAALQSRMVELHKRTEDIHFLNTLQTILNEEKDEGLLIHRTVDLLFSAMGAEAVFYHSLDTGGALLRYCRKRTASEGDFIMPQLVAYLGERKEERLLPPQDNFREFLNAPLDSCRMGSFFIRADEAWKGHFLLFFPGLQQDEEKIRILSLMALQIGFGLEKINQYHLIRRQNEDLQRKNQLLEITSYSDALTGLGNRLALRKSMEREIARHQRYQNAPFSLVFLDLDNFKFFNDTFGHALGDMVLGEVARLIQSTLRDTDQVFRYGGDEFIALLPHTDIEGAMGLGRRIIDALEKMESFVSLIQSRLGDMVYIPPNKKLSCSAGAAQWGFDGTGVGEAEESAETLLERADKALYSAKRAGKGRVRILDLQHLPEED